MKQIVLLFSAIILISCNKFKVEGTAKGIKDGTKVFLEGAGEMGPVAMDTVVIKEGKFQFEGKSELPEIGIISIDGVIDPQYQSKKALPFIIESGTIVIAFDTKEFQELLTMTCFKNIQMNRLLLTNRLWIFRRTTMKQ